MSETVTLPPRTESIVNGEVENRDPVSFKVGLVEITYDYRKTEQNNLFNRTPVSNEKTLPLKIINISPESQALYEDTVIVAVSPVDDIPSAERTIIDQESH